MCCKQGLKEKKFPAPTEIANQIIRSKRNSENSKIKGGREKLEKKKITRPDSW